VRLRAQKECEAHRAGGELCRRDHAPLRRGHRAGAAGTERGLRGIFVCAGHADECVGRVRLRGLSGGHAAPEDEVRDIYARSLSNLIAAVNVFDRIELYDNFARGAAPRFIGEILVRRLVAAVESVPSWVPEPLR
jgi:predicted ABC-type ATPase